MSITIDINGVSIKADTLKEAHRLAHKEEKRQATEEKENDKKQDEANTRAYATLGRLYHSHHQGTLEQAVYLSPPPRHAQTPDGNEHLILQDRGETYDLCLDARYATVEVIGYSANRDTRCIKLHCSASSTPIWHVVGLCGSCHALIEIPESLSVALDQYWQAKD